MPLEWNYNIIYHFLCLLKNPASLRSTFAVSGEFQPLTKDCCKALARRVTPKKAPRLLFPTLFFLQRTSSYGMATRGWRTGSDRGQESRAGHVSASFTFDLMLTLSLHWLPCSLLHQCKQRAKGPRCPPARSRAPEESDSGEADAARSVAGPCCCQSGCPSKGRHLTELG